MRFQHFNIIRENLFRCFPYVEILKTRSNVLHSKLYLMKKWSKGLGVLHSDYVKKTYRLLQFVYYILLA